MPETIAPSAGSAMDARADRRFRLLVESVTDYAIFMLDTEGRVANWNPGAARIKGYAATEIVGEHFSRFYTPEDIAADVPAKALKLARETGRFEAEAWRVRKDGTLFWANVVLVPVFEDGEHVGFAKVTRDLTERREREALRAALASERRDAELREQFIAVLGHDLRNPLGAILSGVRLLRKSPLDAKAARVAGMIEDTGRRMERLIESVLDFARAKLGQGFVISWRRAPLEPSLRQIVAETAASSGNRAMEVDFDIPPAVRCDPDRVCQLFSNLLGNAIAHGAPDRPILVEARPRGGVLSISVANAGKPIPSASMEHLFQPFFRASVRRSREGLGLGLFIAHEIAVAHGGKLRAESNENETRFTFDLPLS